MLLKKHNKHDNYTSHDFPHMTPNPQKNRQVLLGGVKRNTRCYSIALYHTPPIEDRGLGRVPSFTPSHAATDRNHTATATAPAPHYL